MSEPVTELKDRLRAALDFRGIKPVELSEKTGIPKSAISQYMSGYAKPKQDRIYLLSKALEVNEKILREYRPRHAKPNDTLSHWLGGVLICSSCGSVMVSGGSSGGFQCNAYSKGRCMISHYVAHKKIEASVVAALQKIANSGDFEYEVLPVQASDDSVEILKNNIKKLDQKLTRVKEAYVNGVDTLEEYKENKARIEVERKELSNKIRQIKDVKKTKETTKTMINRINNVCAIVTSNANIPKKNTAIKSVVKKIVYDKKSENIDVYLFYS